jgi:hypothetical protein
MNQKSNHATGLILFAAVAAAIMLAVASLTGCGPSRATIETRAELVVTSEAHAARNADAWQALALHHIEAHSTRELERMKAALAAALAAAGSNPDRIAACYVAFYTELEKHRALVLRETETAASLHGESKALASRYRVLSDMATLENSIARETARAGLSEAIALGQRLATEMQTAPVPAPSGATINPSEVTR